MKYLEWLKTNPEKGYYWVKYQDCDEDRIDEFTDWYDNAGNKETRFTDQPEEVISDRLTYDEWKNITDCFGFEHKVNIELIKENEKLREEYEAERHRADELEDSYWKEVEKNKKLKELLKEAEKTEKRLRENVKDAENIIRDDFYSINYMKELLKRQEIGNYVAEEGLQKVVHDWEKCLDEYCEKWATIK